MGLSMTKHTRSADFRADQIDIIKNFAVITNVIIKRVHCIFFDTIRYMEISVFEIPRVGCI